MEEKAAWEDVSERERRRRGESEGKKTQEDIRHPSDFRNGANRIPKRQG